MNKEAPKTQARREPMFYVKNYMVDRRKDDGCIEQVSIEVVNGEWPKGTFTIRRRKAVYDL